VAQGNYAASASDGALEEAQHNKLQMICDKLMLQEGESFLDIGCGWGTLVRHAAKHYGGSSRMSCQLSLGVILTARR